MGGPITNPIKLPNSMENAGVNNRSSFVLPEIKIPNSTATKDAVKAPRGSPGPINKTPLLTENVPARIDWAWAATSPATALPRATKAEASNFPASPTPIPAPVRAIAICPMIAM